MGDFNYNEPVRHLLFALLIALLPLRGWVGDAMAMQSIDQSLPAPASSQAFQADTDSLHAVGLPSDCPGHAAAPVDSQLADGAHHGGINCATCTDCQICHSVALTPPSLSLAAADSSASQLVVLTDRFISAERAPGFKPPIF